MRLRCATLLCLAVLLSVAAPFASAQTCDFFYWNYAIRSDAANCDPGNICPIGQTLTFVVVASTQHLACVKQVEWTMGDGSPATVLAPGVPMTKAYSAAGTFNVKAKLTSTSTPPATIDLAYVVSVGNGLVTMVSESPFDLVATGQEKDGVARVKVRRTNTSGATNVQWKATPGTAKLGIRYSAETGTVTIPAGAAEAEIQFPLINDTIRLGNQSLTLSLTSADGGFAIGAPSGVTLTIVDDERPPTLAFAAPKVTVREDAGTARVKVTRTGDMAGTVTCDYVVPEFSWSTSEWVESVAGTLIFAAGETEKSFDVPIKNNDRWNGTRTITMRLSSPSAGAVFPNDSFAHNGTLEILDDEPIPAISIADVAVLEGSTLTLATLTVKRPAGGNDVALIWRNDGGSATPGRDYQANTGLIFLSAGETEKSFTVRVLGDREPEHDETVTIRLSFEPSYRDRAVLERETATLTIVNDDAGLAPATLRMPRGETREAMLDLGQPVTQTKTIPLHTQSAGVVELPPSVVVTPGNARATFAVKALANGITSIAATVGEGELTMSVIVHEAGGLVFSPAAVSAFAGRDATVRVTLDPPSTKPQTIALQSGGAIASVPATVVIPAGGAGSFVVKALKRGGTSISAKLPDEYGGASVTLMVDVTDAPDGPAMSSITPATGPHAGGTAFEVVGSKLTADCRILFDGIPAIDQKVIGATEIRGVTPMHAAGPVAVELACDAGRFTLANAFTYIASAPSLRAVTPGFGAASGGTHVRATGANLYSGCWLFFGDVAARAVNTFGATEMTAVVPPGKSGSVDVVVRCGQQSAVLRSGFSYTPAGEPAPAIASVDPLVGGAGQHVTITGLRFRPTDRITFDTTPATILRTAPESHVVRIPDLPLGKTSIQLTDSEGRLTTTGPIFRIIEPMPPRISSATPARVFPGSEVVLEGSGFRPGYVFSVGGAPARVVRLEYDRAIVRLAAGTAAGSHAIEVLNASQQLAAIGPSLDVVAGGPSIVSASPSCAASDGGTEVVLTGSGFEEGLTVTINGVATVVTVMSGSEIRVVTRGGAVGAATIVVTNADGDSAANSDAFRYVSPLDPDAACGTSRARNVRH